MPPSRSKALQVFHSESGLSRCSNRTMGAALPASCRVWGISSVLNNPFSADTSCVLFPHFRFSQIHSMKKHAARTSYGHRGSLMCARESRAGNQGRSSHLAQTGEGKGCTPAGASPIPHSLPGNQLSHPLGSAPPWLRFSV